MPKGFWNRILRVDLSSGKISTDEPGEKFYRTYLGGRGIVAHYLFKEVPAGADPLGPENKLIFAASVLTGTRIPGAARNSVGAKSPLTGGYGDGEAGGFWGVRLRWAGYDGLIVEGKAERPVYLWITDETVEIRDAAHLWGKAAHETQAAIRADVGEKSASVALIGRGGEAQIPYACIALDLHDYVGRAGIGAVMGAKNLKAVAVNGKKRPEVADDEALKRHTRWMMENYETFLGTMQEMGTARGVPIMNAGGGLPTRNFKEGSFEGVETISGRYMADTILVGRHSCYACPVNCKREVELESDDFSVSPVYSGPEYETIASFGSNLGIADLKYVARANQVCNAETLDTISTGMMIAGAFEAAERGLLPAGLTAGLELRFGSGPGLLRLLDQILNREGLGAILAGGIPAVEKKLGPEVAALFLHSKRQPLPLHEPRWKAALGIGYALSPTGADHMHNIHDPMYESEEAPTFAAARSLGILHSLPTLELSPAKARLYVYMMLYKTVNNSVSICSFMPFTLEMMVDQVRGATGWNLTDWEVLKATERAMNLARAFNAREGFRLTDDDIPERFFQPLEGGTLKGHALERQKFLETRDLVYDMLGWDRNTAAPRRWKLYELGLDWIIPELEAHEALSD